MLSAKTLLDITTWFAPSWLVLTCFLVGYLSISLYLGMNFVQWLYKDQDLRQMYKTSEGAKCWAIVTGASSGIGKAIAEKLAQQNINVIMIALPDAIFDKSFLEITSRFPQVEFKKIALDLGATDPKSYLDPIDEAMTEVALAGGEVRMLFNNAGYIVPGLFSQIPLEKHMNNVNCNASAMIAITHRVLQTMIKLPVMSDGKRGLISFTSSSAGFLPCPISSIYGCTKTLMTSFAAALSVELQVSDTNIDVICVHPSPIRTNFYDNAKDVSLITAFKWTALAPSTIADIIFKSAGKCVIYDQGYFSIGMKLLLKVLDWNLLAEISGFFMKNNADVNRMRARGLTVKDARWRWHDTLPDPTTSFKFLLQSSQYFTPKQQFQLQHDTRLSSIMSDEIRDFDEQLTDIIGEIRNTLTVAVPKLQGKAKVEKCEYLKNRINRARQVLKSFNVELRELSRESAKPWEEKARTFDQEITKLNDDLSWAMTSAERDDLFNKPTRNADQMTAKELVDHASNVQKESKQSTERTKQVLQHTIDVGTKTNEVLKEQTVQLETIDQNVDLIESNLTRADKQIRIFLRRMATDKVILAMVLLVIIAIITTIVVAIVRSKISGKPIGGASDIFNTGSTGNATVFGFR
ncbi:hypothetical protein MIR68_012649 [Amoeboaphelidium protococcarum]|nr:hypothetical protein MIR68_012649 [Amoeboaphelidium protococcarum]